MAESINMIMKVAISRLSFTSNRVSTMNVETIYRRSSAFFIDKGRKVCPFNELQQQTFSRPKCPLEGLSGWETKKYHAGTKTLRKGTDRRVFAPRLVFLLMSPPR